jgi:hypothetical protein
MDLYSKQTTLANPKPCKRLPKRFNVVGSVGPPREVRQVELNLIPAFVESHGHGANEWLDPGCALQWLA